MEESKPRKKRKMACNPCRASKTSCDQFPTGGACKTCSSRNIWCPGPEPTIEKKKKEREKAMRRQARTRLSHEVPSVGARSGYSGVQEVQNTSEAPYQQQFIGRNVLDCHIIHDGSIPTSDYQQNNTHMMIYAPSVLNHGHLVAQTSYGHTRQVHAPLPENRSGHSQAFQAAAAIEGIFPVDTTVQGQVHRSTAAMSPGNNNFVSRAICLPSTSGNRYSWLPVSPYDTRGAPNAPAPLTEVAPSQSYGVSGWQQWYYHADQNDDS